MAYGSGHAISNTGKITIALSLDRHVSLSLSACLSLNL